MPHLSWISDDNLLHAVKGLLNTATIAKDRSDVNFDRNVIDPFAAVFEMAGFKIGFAQWMQNEVNRQAQKTLQNSIGNFHQVILGSCSGWRNMATTRIIDLENSSKMIIAEIKNKYNTVKGSDMVNVYQSLERAVMDKNSIYKGFTAYHVAIIPATNTRYIKSFMTSNNQTGARVTENPLIKQIDGASFYELVTGSPNALKDLFDSLPSIISGITGNANNLSSQQLSSIFTKAYG